MVLLDKCCICVSLRIGCITLAYIYLVGTISTAALMIMDTFFGVQVITERVNIPASGLELILNGILIVYLVGAIVFSILLLTGLHGNEPEYVKVFLIYMMIFLISYAVLFVVKTTNGIGYIIEGLVYLVFGAYFFLITGSYYLKMRNSKPSHWQRL